MGRILSPSMLSADFTNLGKDLREAADAGAEYLHVDVMDGCFVPNISFGPPVIRAVRKILPDTILDVHLMIEEPIRYISEFRACGADILTVHAEAAKDLPRTLKEIGAAGMKIGVAISPDTPVSVIEPVLHQCDQVLVMSVYPGFGGQGLIPETLEKIRELVTLRENRKLSYMIEIDGGVKTDNLEEVLEAGTDVIVAGSAIFGKDIPAEVKKFLEILRRR